MRWKAEVEIGGRSISPTDPTYFIADIAANHDVFCLARYAAQAQHGGQLAFVHHATRG